MPEKVRVIVRSSVIKANVIPKKITCNVKAAKGDKGLKGDDGNDASVTLSNVSLALDSAGGLLSIDDSTEILSNDINGVKWFSFATLKNKLLTLFARLSEGNTFDGGQTFNSWTRHAMSSPNKVYIGPASNDGNFTGIWLAGDVTTPHTGTYSLLYGANSIFFNAPNFGTVYFRIGNVTQFYVVQNTGAVFNGTANRMPNQTDATSDSVITRSLIKGLYGELAANQNIANSTTFTDITGLSIALPVGKYKLTSCVILSPANSTMGQKVSLITSGGATGTMVGFNDFSSNSVLSQRIPYLNAAISALSGGDARQVAGGTHGQASLSKHDLIVTVTAGVAVFRYQFAQHTLNVSNLTAIKGSYIRAQRID